MSDLTVAEHPEAQKIAYFKSLARSNGHHPPAYDYDLAVGDFCQAAGEVTARREKVGEVAQKVWRMKVFVATGDWGGARTEDIRAVAKDVLGHLSSYFPDLGYLGNAYIIIQKSPDGRPRTLYREDLSDPFFINLTTVGNQWAQVAYQFAHELCHVLSNHDKLRKKNNQWFQEALCELASIFCVFRMAESWKTKPPYPNWKDYAQQLGIYAQEFLNRPEHKLPDSHSLAGWLQKNLVRLRADAGIRELSAIVAIRLLPTFQAKPETWESIRFIPDIDESFEQFLKQWRSTVPEHLHIFVDEIAGVFE